MEPSSVVHDYKEEGQPAQTELKSNSPGSQPNQRSQPSPGICTNVEQGGNVLKIYIFFLHTQNINFLKIKLKALFFLYKREKVNGIIAFFRDLITSEFTQRYFKIYTKETYISRVG